MSGVQISILNPEATQEMTTNIALVLHSANNYELSHSELMKQVAHITVNFTEEEFNNSINFAKYGGFITENNQIYTLNDMLRKDLDKELMHIALSKDYDCLTSPDFGINSDPENNQENKEPEA